MRWLFVCTFVLALPVGLFAGPSDDASRVFQFVDRTCTPCHNAKLSQGEVNLKIPHDLKTFVADRDLWERAVDKIKNGEMPPPGIPKPTAKDVDAVTHWLEAEFLRQDQGLKPRAGRVAPRRLNRFEYTNTVRDLLGVEFDAAASFPPDETAYGFDNIGDALNLSSVLLEKYVDAAEKVVRTAIFGEEKRKPAMAHYPSPVRIPKLPATFEGYDETGLSTLHATHVLHRFPVEGTYSFKLVLNGHRPNDSEPVHPALYIDGKLIREWEVDATDLEGQICEVRTKVGAGEHLISATYHRNYEGLPPSYNGPNPSKREPITFIRATKVAGANLGNKMTKEEVEFYRKYGTRVKTDRIDVRVDNRFESIDIGGPFTQPVGPSVLSRSRVFVCSQRTTACAQTIVRTFAKRAFRRPLQPGEADRFLKVYALVRKHGDSFEEGIANALQAILVSPHFLYRIEQHRSEGVSEGGGEDPRVSDFELATRLSYFLWSSTPDATLLQLAAAKRLSEPAVIAAQVRRMLADAKANAFVESFAGQWLQIKNIDVMKPDLERFPQFDEALRYYMRRETMLFLEDVLRNNRNVLNLLSADYTYLNERLARFYGVPGVKGAEFRRVDMAQTKRGGGILAHGSVLTLSSYSTRTSPVLRGKWILENLLHSPPPPPPAAVPALDDTKIGESATLRQQMEEHRKNPACASCHARMDPLGFGMENFDAIGAWRDTDGKFPVDASGELPNGKRFSGPVELKRIVAEERERFLRGLSEKLLTYALGRGLERSDKLVVNEMVRRASANGYQFHQLVLAVVESHPFQRRQVNAIPPGVPAE